MKKIGDKNFWIILSLSIITLIALTIGVIFLTRKSSKEFYSAGYIINSTTTKSDKYYFNDNTIYKENVFGEYVFKDVDNNEVSTNKDNFIHYLDNSLSFMKNGVILDLDNFNEKIVPYYNITDKIILKYNNGGYIIETNDKTLVFGNILGRITDNKYIILGSDIRIKLSGNEEPVKGKYFELLFVEDGIAKVENNEGSYQTTTEGTTIFVGDNIKIDLGTKKVFYAEEEKLTLDEMTIDGNENIDIDTSKVKEENKGNDSDSNNNINNQENNNANKPIDADKNENNNNVNNGEETIEIKKEVSVDLVNALVDINSLKVTIQVIDTINAIKGNLILTLYDVDNNKTIPDTKTLSTVSDLQEKNFNSLTPDTNYYMSIKDSEGYEYLARNIRTGSLDLSLKRDMVTTNSVSYSVDFNNNENIKSAKALLYKESKNDENGELISWHTFVNGEDTSFEFTGLEKNTNYKVVLEDVIFKNTNYSKTYTINSSFQTLKEKPTIGNISVKADEKNKTFELSMERPKDEDESISNYIYKIYDDDDLEGNPVYTFSTVNLKNEILKLGENRLEANKNYKYKVTIRYYDNYKDNEIDTPLSDPFIIAGLPTITFEEKEIDFNSAKILLTLKDEGCTVPISGRTCYKESSDKDNIYIRYKNVRESDSNYKRIDNITFNQEDLTYELNVTGLSENTDYVFEVWGNYNLHNGEGLKTNKQLGSHIIKTSGVEKLTMTGWKANNYSSDLPISVNTEMISTVSNSTIIDKLDSFKIKLYKGKLNEEELSEENLLGSYDVIGNDNIKTNYYNKSFNINSSQFGITDINNLREISGGKLSKYYTIEIAEAYDKDETNLIPIDKRIYSYEIPTILVLEDEVSSPEIFVKEITKEQAKSGIYGDFDSLGINKYLSSDTVVGYRVTVKINNKKIESYFQGESPIKNVNFYANINGTSIEKKIVDFNEGEECKLIEYEDSSSRVECAVNFFLKDGTDYNTLDKDLRRGNTYTFSMDLSLDTNNDKEIDTSYPNKKPTSIAWTSTKEEPRINMYVDSSTSNSITYKYTVIDYDNALVKEEDKYLIYYTVGESEEEYTTEISNTASMETFTISNLINNTIYNLSYKKALTKRETPNSINFKYYFDGYHDAKEYNLGYELKYYDFDNEITLTLNDNEFINRISAYLVTLTAGSLKYQEVISNLSDCGENKCIKIDYAKIKDFKGKETTVTLEAFYDNGIAGFSSKSLLGDYFKNLGLVEDASASKIGFIYQEVGNTAPGKYYYIYKNSSNRIESVISETPKGILGIDAKIYKESNKTSTLTTSNMVDITKNTFINYGEISLNSDVDVLTNGIKLKSHNIYINPKVLDKVEIQPIEGNKFKFTSIIPKVSTTLTPLINGAVVDINLSIDTDTLETDYVKTDGKYKFYIDIYTKDEENNLILVKTVETDYENLTNISFAGLNPDSTYYYKISADMNKNGTKVKTPLFAQGKNGYIEYAGTLKTLGKDDIFKNIEYSHNSQKGETVYSSRTLKVTTGLKSKENFNVKYELYDINNVLEKEGTVLNKDITSNNNAIFTTDISGNDFVFGGDYHRLVITAVTTDAEPKTLELYNDKLKQTTLFNELKKPNITLNQSTGIDEVSGEYDYYISYNIVIEDTDRVIEDGKVNIELEDSTYTNACPNAEDCKVEIDLFNLTCNSNGTNSRIKSCSVTENTANNKFTLNITYNKLEADTNYFIYMHSDIYRNNLSLTNKEEVVYVRKGQYTRSELNFSLGSPTLTAKTNKLIMTFVGSTNVPNSIKGIEYNVNEEGAGKISSGMMGLIPSGTSSLVADATNYGDIIYTFDKDGYPYIEIPIPEGKTLGKTNFITITYYYEENGNLIKLSINGKTVQQYYVKDVS